MNYRIGYWHLNNDIVITPTRVIETIELAHLLFSDRIERDSIIHHGKLSQHGRLSVIDEQNVTLGYTTNLCHMPLQPFFQPLVLVDLHV